MTLAFSLSFWSAARPDSLHAQGGAPIQSGIREGNFSAAESTTPFQQFVSQLRLDNDTQAPAAAQTFQAAAREAAPVAQQLMLIRQRFLNLTLADRSAEIAGELAAYSEAAATMTGLELSAFSKVYATLKQNQQSRAARAWTLMAGIFLPPPPAPPRGEDSGVGRVGSVSIQLRRLELLEEAFDFKGDAKKAVKTIFDEAHKSAAPVREQLAAARSAIVAALQAGAPQTEMDAAVKAYAEVAGTMTALEMTSLGKALQTLDKSALSNTTALQSAFFLTRGMFLNKDRWDAVPEYQGY
jgi:hypothetical protein